MEIVGRVKEVGPTFRFDNYNRRGAQLSQVGIKRKDDSEKLSDALNQKTNVEVQKFQLITQN